ncbi:MAG: NUDIX domain-containing protein [Hyphomicrobiales bacterium]|nr:NUDIX domain-containing protein [Hyphomicrobiales bacterium]
MTNVHTDRTARLNEFLQRMNKLDCDLSHKVIRPKDAATLILVDRSGTVPKVLLGKRHTRHKFMPGKFVFPGGCVDPCDKSMPVARPLNPQAEMRLMQRFHRASPARARALALAAVRETFEETGLLLGVRGEVSGAPDGAWAEFSRHKVIPDLQNLRFIGRAITPPRRELRFDARFFTTDASAIAHRVDGVTGPDSELVELVWMPLNDAKRLDMPAVTSVMLEELGSRIADGFGHDLPVPFYRPIRGLFRRDLL